MFDEEGNGDVKTQELERLMSLMGINPTKRELSQMAKDVDKNGNYTCSNVLIWKETSFFNTLKSPNWLWKWLFDGFLKLR